MLLPAEQIGAEQKGSGAARASGPSGPLPAPRTGRPPDPRLALHSLTPSRAPWAQTQSQPRGPMSPARPARCPELPARPRPTRCPAGCSVQPGPLHRRPSLPFRDDVSSGRSPSPRVSSVFSFQPLPPSVGHTPGSQHSSGPLRAIDFLVCLCRVLLKGEPLTPHVAPALDLPGAGTWGSLGAPFLGGWRWGSPGCGGRRGLETVPEPLRTRLCPPLDEERSRGRAAPPGLPRRTEGALVWLVPATSSAEFPIFRGSALWPAEQEARRPLWSPRPRRVASQGLRQHPGRKDSEKGVALPQDRGVPTSQARPPVLSCCLWGMGWGAWAPLLGRALSFPAPTLTSGARLHRGITPQRCLHDALSIAGSEASGHHWGHSRCSCPALSDRQFSPWLFAKECH